MARRRLRSLTASNTGDLVFKLVAVGLTLSVLVLAVLMVGVMFQNSRESIAEYGIWDFVTAKQWDPVFRNFGALAVIVGTLVSALIAVVLAVPVAIGIAIYIVEIAPPRFQGPIAFLVDTLAAVPSIVFGLWAAFVMVPWLRQTPGKFLVNTFGDWIPLFKGPHFGFSMLAAGVILAVMIVPIISAVAREVIASVPMAQKEGLLALGATRWEVVRKVILPTARAGIVGAVILGLGRAIGETMAVTMVIGNRHELTWSLMAPNSTIPSIIANEFREATYDLYLSALIHLALVLMVISLGINVMARSLVWSATRGQTSADAR